MIRNTDNKAQDSITDNRSVEELILKKLESIRNESSARTKASAVYDLFTRIYYLVSEDEKILFSSLYSRMAYVSSKYNIDGKLLILSHYYRKLNEQDRKEWKDEELAELGEFLIRMLCDVLWNGISCADIPENDIPGKEKMSFLKNKNRSKFHSTLSVVLLEKSDTQSGDYYLVASIENENGKEATVCLEKDQIDEANFKLIDFLDRNDKFPCTASLVDVSLNEDSIYYPKVIVWQPDYLIEVTGISECFSGRHAEPIKYMLHKLLPTDPNPYILAGNISNYFLDQLLYDNSVSYKELLVDSFSHHPLDYSLLKKSELDIVVERIKTAYHVLHKVVSTEFDKEDITARGSVLEPTFISPGYGIHGRLDLFQLRKSQNAAEIVELKTGSPFNPNSYGLGNNHYMQTLLYDMLIQSAHPDAKHRKSYILYAREHENPLKYAPAVRPKQLEALLLRNRLIMVEDLLRSLDDSGSPNILDRISMKYNPHLKGYDRDAVVKFEKLWKVMNSIEKAYVSAFIGMIAREQHISKIGTEGIDGRRGMASLWLQSMSEKELNFSILRRLRVREDRSAEDNPIVVFDRTNFTNALANFRKGDIVIAYLEYSIKNGSIRDQVYKSSIVHIDSEGVHIRLRSRQCGKSPFEKGTYWNLEPDVLDSSFLNSFQNVVRWMGSSASTRKKLLAVDPPEKPKEDSRIEDDSRIFSGATDKQVSALHKMLCAEDYFLLWGPPGTGKTSVMLKSFVDYIYTHTDEKLLLLAYTNRAVDEICEAVSGIPGLESDGFLRIGSRYGTADRFKDQLMQNQLQDAESREKVREKITSYRVYVGTVASFSHKQHITKLVDIDRVVIDECSQLLDPMILPIFSKFQKVIMIGDHKQLPAVVSQSEDKTEIKNPRLRKLGIENLRHSLFERLYKKARSSGWDWAYDQLNQQGRMHESIMKFSADRFYEDSLFTIREEQLRPEEQMPYNFTIQEPEKAIEGLMNKRMLYVPTEIAETPSNIKINENEAEKVVEILKFYHSHSDIQMENIGVITPYRAQIAHILDLIYKEIPEIVSRVTVDTVERYQGSSRDVIILSLCTNKLFQLEMNKLTSDVLDRKLNVAVTRSREQLIILGNREIMEKVDDYRELVKYCEQK